MDAKESSATDLKRPREEDDNGAAATMETENGDQKKEPACFSTVIPGWFSEMSPMWPGLLLFLSQNKFWLLIIKKLNFFIGLKLKS